MKPVTARPSKSRNPLRLRTPGWKDREALSNMDGNLHHRPRTRPEASEIQSADFDPAEVRYIKLGKNGIWAADALKNGTLPFDYRFVGHDACLAWDEATIRRQLREMGRAPGGSVTSALRELREFYTLPRDTLWVTMADGHLWWAFADETVLVNHDMSGSQPPRYRNTIAGWSNSAIKGKALTKDCLSSAITKTASCQMTICKFEHQELLLQRINEHPDKLLKEVEAAQADMIGIVRRMIDRLDWQDFETLVDLIFQNGGWRRTGILGKNQADVDMILEQPVTGEKAWVQVKSIGDHATLKNYRDRFLRDGSCQRFFFICHRAQRGLSSSDDGPQNIWTGEKVANATINAGLVGWLKERI